MPEPLHILLDENVPYGARRWLNAEVPWAKVDHVHDLGFASRSDEALYRWAEQRRAIVVTFDEDFADQRRFPPGGRCGVLRLRVEPTNEAMTCQALRRVLDAFDLDSLRGKLAIVDARRIRLIGPTVPPTTL